jgi:hypothetical protein
VSATTNRIEGEVLAVQFVTRPGSLFSILLDAEQCPEQWRQMECEKYLVNGSEVSADDCLGWLFAFTMRPDLPPPRAVLEEYAENRYVPYKSVDFVGGEGP